MPTRSIKGGTTPLPSTIDPKVFLLEPKRNGASTKASKVHKEVANPYQLPTGDEQSDATAQDESTSKMAPLMEQLHNVESRLDRPQKRQKKAVESGDGDQDDDEELVKKKTKTSTHGGTGGDISDYMKQRRKEAAQDENVVDLTEGMRNYRNLRKTIT